MKDRLLIIGDEQIAYIDKVFCGFHKLITLPTSELTCSKIQKADVLLVRSVTKVNEELLKGTKVKIIGSVTSGIDHIDRKYLRRNGIKLLYAPGSNANSVAEYVIACLLIIAKRKKISLTEKTIGIIGVGNVGKRVAKKCQALGMQVLLNDPPKFIRTKDKRFLSLKNPSEADIITLHIPLTFSGKYRTFHLINEEFLRNIKEGSILINTSRGKVIDENALLKYHSKLGGLILDVWENEPDINIELLKRVDIGTPHIAGYSLDGRFNGTFMVYRKLCRLLNRKPDILREKILPRLNKKLNITLGTDLIDTLCNTVLKVYNPELDHQSLVKIVKLNSAQRQEYFKLLRRNYPERREFFNYIPIVKATESRMAESQQIMNILKELGFKVVNS